MAKFSQGILGPFQGKVGTVVGYMWNGKCCMRAYNRTIKNPRTPEQVAHRNMFKQEVQLAAEMRWVLNATMRDQARAMGMTCRNLFMKANQHAFSLEEGVLQVDYSQLVLSMGDVPGVEATETSWSADNVLTVKFDRGMGNAYHHVYLYVHVPDLADPDNPAKGFLAAPVHRRDKRISVALPDAFAGHTAQLYLMVQSDDGRWSESEYVGPHPLMPDTRPYSNATDILSSPRGEGESLTTLTLSLNGEGTEDTYTIGNEELGMMGTTPPRSSTTPPKEGTAGAPWN